MLTPQELRNIPEDVVSIFEECEDEILRLIGERIRAVGYLNTVSLWQLIKRKESLLFKRNVTRTLSKYTGLSQRQIRKVFKKAGAKALLHDDTFLKAITTKDTRKRTRALDKILKEAYEQTNGTLHNWTGTTANNATNHFVHAMDKAALQVQSGAFSYDEAIRRATRDLADHMDYVTYESGHKDTLEVASRRAVRTGVNQMASKLTLERCKQVGTEFVETTAHVGARETDSEDCTNHSWWQGKVFHLSEEGAVGEDGKFYPGFYSYDQAGYGYGAGICGWNCRHSFHPFIPGVSEPIYTPEELAKLNEKNIEYEGQKYSRYEIDQKQRGLERQVRKYKRREILAESVGDEQEVMRNKAFVRKWQGELDKFTKETGLKRDYERERETVRNNNNQTGAFINSKENNHSIALINKDTYNESPEETVLERLYREGVETGWISPLCGFENYKKLYEQLMNEVVGLKTTTGVEIKCISKHFMERVIGTSIDPSRVKDGILVITKREPQGYRSNSRSGTSIEGIKQTILEGEVRKTTVTEEGDISQTVYGQHAVVTINPETGKLVQCNPLD